MPDGKDPALNQLEQTLIRFLSSKSEVKERIMDGERKIRGLSIKLTGSAKEPKIVLQIGIIESVFNTATFIRERGNCYGLDKYIREWLMRSSVTELIKNYVNSNRNKLNS